MQRFSNSYLGRVVGGAEEAALRFLIDLQAEEITSERSVAGCLAVAMGKVAWDKNQINRSVIAKLKGDYPEMGVFRAANTYLGRTRLSSQRKERAMRFRRAQSLNWSPPTSLPKGTGARILWIWSKQKKTSTACTSCREDSKP